MLFTRQEFHIADKVYNEVSMKKIIIGISLLIIIGASMFLYRESKKNELVRSIQSFTGCVAAGFPVMESFPARCITPDGRSFTQDIDYETEYRDLIVVDYPRSNVLVSSPLNIFGKARGQWYFEGSFTAELFDAKDALLGTSVIQAQGEWMTNEFVPFASSLAFTQPGTQTGKLVLKNANPSGLPENDKQLIIPVNF